MMTMGEPLSENEMNEMMKDLLVDESILLQLGETEGWLTLDSSFYNSATKEWDMYAQNSIIMFTCLDRAVDFPGPPAYNCIFDGE